MLCEVFSSSLTKIWLECSSSYCHIKSFWEVITFWERKDTFHSFYCNKLPLLLSWVTKVHQQLCYYPINWYEYTNIRHLQRCDSGLIVECLPGDRGPSLDPKTGHKNHAASGGCALRILLVPNSCCCDRKRIFFFKSTPNRTSICCGQWSGWPWLYSSLMKGIQK